MAIKILDLSYKAKQRGGGVLQENGGFVEYPPVPYMIINCVFKISDDPHLYSEAKTKSMMYRKVVKTKSPEEEDREFEERWSDAPDGVDGRIQFLLDVVNSKPAPEQFWTYGEQYWNHVEKFDIFWFREWVADSPITREILKELRFFQTEGKLPTVYRTIDEGIVLKHLETLWNYWD